MNRKSLIFLVTFLVLASVGTGYAVTTHTMGTGDTLWELSARHYGDPTLYPVLLEVNGIDNPRTIPNGKVIIIPDKATMQNIARENDPAKKRNLISQATSGNVVPPGDEMPDPQTPTNTGKDAESRTGAVDPDETTFINILKGPKVSPDKLIQHEKND